MEPVDDRHETPTERLDRNWTDLLQELRVIQTGVQFLTGFLLTLPFQQRFTELSQFQRGVYLGTVAASVVSTVLLQAPVSVHRTLFRRHERAQAVGSAHHLLVAGMSFLALAMVGVSYLVFSVVSGTPAAVSASAVAVLLIVVFWVVYPRMLRLARGAQPARRPPASSPKLAEPTGRWQRSTCSTRALGGPLQTSAAWTILNYT